MVNIEGLDKAKVLKALYDGSHVQGMGFMQAVASFTEEDAKKELEQLGTYFDYLHGRVMKVNLESDIEFEEWGYDRDNYKGCAQDVINKLRKSLGIIIPSPVCGVNEPSSTELLTFKSIEENYPITVEKNDVFELMEMHYRFSNTNTNDKYGYNVSYRAHGKTLIEQGDAFLEDRICRQALEGLGIII